MKTNIDRRQFIQASALLVGGAALQLAVAAPAPAGRIKKAVGWEMIAEPKLSLEDKFRVAKDVGFEGVEVSRRASKKDALDVKALAQASEKIGIPIHGLSNGSNMEDRKSVV